MLLSLHVKNLALIEEEEVVFTDGLNILTGETGAGKSIIIGSVNLGLGARADKSIIRTGSDYALIELTFRADNEVQLKKLEESGLFPEEDNIILIKRKILPQRSICSICGETVTLKQLREAGELLIDIYGQRENQRLLRREAQRKTLDEYGGDVITPLLSQAADSFRAWKKLTDEWDKNDMDESARLREMDLLTYEADEIEAASLKEGEEEELEKEQRILGSFRKISECAGSAYQLTSEGGAAGSVGRACRELSRVAGIVSNGAPVAGTIYDMLSPEAKAALDDADVILAKGQGNYETLGARGRHVFYSMLCKCDLFVERFRVPRFTGIFLEEYGDPDLPLNPA